MDALMAFVSIAAIIAIVVVAGGLVAFIGHMIIGAFDNERRDTVAPKEMLDYSQYKQLESARIDSLNDIKENIDSKIVEEEKAKLEETTLNNDFKIEEDGEDIASIEELLKKEVQEDVKVEDEEIDNVFDDDDIDALLDEISSDIIEEEQEQNIAEETPKMDESLSKYDINTYLQEESEIVEEEKVDEVVSTDEVAEVKDEMEEIETEETESVEETEDEEEIELFDESDLLEDEDEDVVEVAPVVEKAESVEDSKAEIERLKAELASLNQKLADVTNNKVEVVTVNATEEECIERLAVLEERLKNVKKDYKINMKEYRPLKKVMSDYERYQTKLRRKDAMVAKKKVALYGVNNYVDIDKEKAEKLANELELLNGLRLSVSHCEEVINANKDRYPILEHTNKILEDQITHIEADIISTQAMLKKIREDNGEGENNK